MSPLLYLPEHWDSSKGPQKPPREFIGVHIGRRELTGKAGTLSELVERLSRLSCERVMGAATFIGTLFDYYHRHSLQEQFSIAQSVLPDDLLQGLKRRWTDSSKQGEVLFHRQQLWFVIQLATICCPTKAPDQSKEEEETRAIGECLAIANDIIGDQLTKRHREDRNANSAEWFMAAGFLSMLELNWHATGPVCPSRAIGIWSELLESNQAAVRKLLDDKSPNEAFKDAYGVSLNDYLAFLAIIHSLFHDQNEKKRPLRIEMDVLLLLGGHDVVEGCLALLARTPEGLASDLIFRPRQSWAADFSPLRQHPIIRLQNDRFVCPDLQLLEYYFDDALYWLVVNAYPPGSSIQQLYGDLFEQHVHNVIGAFADHGALLAQQFFRSPKFVGSNDQASDAVFDWSEILALVEYKASRLTRYHKYGGDSEALLAGIENAYAKSKDTRNKGVAQLAQSVNRVLKGEDIVGCSPLGTRLILPILIIAEPGLCNEFVRRLLDQKLIDKLSPDYHLRVLPLVLISQFDIEAFETYIGQASAEAIMRRYANLLRVEKPNLLDSFGAYVQRNYGNVAPTHAIYMQKLRAEQMYRIASQYEIPDEFNVK